MAPTSRPRRRHPRTEPFGRALLAVRVVHPVPSTIVAVVVVTLATVAGAGPPTALALALAMLGFQFSIGALNDLVDAAADAAAGVRKPIPAGVVSRRSAALLAGLGSATGLAISAGFGPVVLGLGAGGWLCGIAYDAWLRRLGLGWVCFAAAIPLLLTWTWIGAAGHLPPTWPLVLPMAALVGPTLHLANSLVDVEHDTRAGRRTLATRLGPRRARMWLSLSVVVILLLAIAAIGTAGRLHESTTGAIAGAMVIVGSGLGLCWLEPARAREAGWLLLTIGWAALAVVWLAG